MWMVCCVALSKRDIITTHAPQPPSPHDRLVPCQDEGEEEDEEGEEEEKEEKEKSELARCVQ